MLRTIATSSGVAAALALAGVLVAMPAEPSAAAPTAEHLQVAPATPAPGYRADCTGGHGDVNAHRYSVNHNVPAREYNTSGSRQTGVVTANSKIHIYYETYDEYGKFMWAMKAGGLCGYLYSTDIVWNKSW
ncbi:hypothetical protein [Amycolatopsis sp. NPDC051371]|uniref:hypothetical protein n=1 Tax=Amycolatopsis sp. NPDC051371 TaxID=3155800 RepID=UPI00342D4915